MKTTWFLVFAFGCVCFAAGYVTAPGQRAIAVPTPAANIAEQQLDALKRADSADPTRNHYMQVMGSTIFTDDVQNEVTAQCPQGTGVTGGGYMLMSTSLPQGTDTAPLANEQTGNGWTVRVKHDAAAHVGWAPFALCAANNGRVNPMPLGHAS